MNQLIAPNGASIRIFPNIEAMAEAFAEALTAMAALKLENDPWFSLALTGGKTPIPLYRRLAEPPFDERIDWGRVKIFYGDERSVGPDHADSNYRMSREAWLGHGRVPEENIHRMIGEALDPDGEGVRYGELLERNVLTGEGGFPSLDLTLLGMGDDGHVASLFPGTPGLAETRAIAMANPVAKLATTRLTLTMPTLNASRAVWFLVSGESKAARVAQAAGFAPDDEAIPAARVKPVQGSVTWWLDEAAASQIPAGS